MKLAEIQEHISRDSDIDNNDLSMESLRIPMLHARYFSMMIDELKASKGIEFTYNTLYREKFEYYMGKSSNEVYDKNPLNHKILKQDLDIYLNSDADLADIKSKLELQKIKVDLLESFIKSLTNRSFQIKNAIEWIKFRAGE